jgi:hypothetical protein
MIVSNGPMENDLPEYMVIRTVHPRHWHAHHFDASVEARRGAHALQHADDVNDQSLGRPCYQVLKLRSGAKQALVLQLPVLSAAVVKL